MAKTIGAATWAGLHREAVAAMGRAYAPYSRYPVGAAALVDDGRVVTGCNVENAAYGVALCAECGLVSELVNSGGGRLVAFACVNAHGDAISPCGRCRQLLMEHGGPDLQLAMPGGTMTMQEVLPGAFGTGDLDQVRDDIQEDM
ncbi:MAG: cytidine deaminase [Actinomyces sp.]|nr:cytidine deaminase [Actinomyces sp.]MDN6565704.1 cytidine deaminase [Actinomyces sp.]